MADIQTVSLTQGNTPRKRFKVISAGSALNLGGVTVTAVIKPNEYVADDDDDAHTLTVGNGLTLVDAASGLVDMDIPAAVTASPGWWHYRIDVLAGETDRETAIEGHMPVGAA